MPIRFDCEYCKQTISVKDELAGRRGKCPRCSEVVQVPADDVPPEIYEVAGSTGKQEFKRVAVKAKPNSVGEEIAKQVEPTRPTQTPSQILAAFRGEIKPVRASFFYRFWLLIVALVMLLLPLIYVGFVAGVGAGVAAYAVFGTAIFRNVRNARVAIGLYLLPIIVGAILFVFLIKPLFARSQKRSKTRTLDPTKEPLVFAFVDGVCTSVGAPRPSRIDITCDVNASAHREGGPFSIFSNDLVLTIGLPLVAGLDLKQFAGVLAHEFGHFSQGAGMRVSGLIYAVNRWFARVVYERDEWDETIEYWAHDDSMYTVVIGNFAKLAVWVARRVLWALMMVGHAVSCMMSRQMEFDADRYEARMVGGKVFASTCWRLRELNVAMQGAYGDLASSWNDRRLPDDLPKLMLANLPQIPQPLLQSMRMELNQKGTGLFDTHPADKDRIAKAKAEKTDGIFHLDGPATDLFRNFDTTAKSLTFEHYRLVLGSEISKEQLYPVEEVVEKAIESVEMRDVTARFMLGSYTLFQTVPLEQGYPAASGDLGAAKEALIAAREAMFEHREANRVLIAKRKDAHIQEFNAQSALHILNAGGKISAERFSLSAATQGAAQRKLQEMAALRESFAVELASGESAIADRIQIALGMLENETVADRVPEGRDRRAETRALWPFMVHFATRLAPESWGLMLTYQAYSRILTECQEQKVKDNNHPLVHGLWRAGRAHRDKLSEMRWKIGDVIEYPFEHAKEGVTIGQYVLPVIPAYEDIGETLHVTKEAFDRLNMLYERAFGRVIYTVEEVERILGLKPPALEQEAKTEANFSFEPNFDQG